MSGKAYLLSKILPLVLNRVRMIMIAWVIIC